MIDPHEWNKITREVTEGIKDDLNNLFQMYFTEVRLLPEDLQWINKQKMDKTSIKFIKGIQHTGKIRKDINEIKETSRWDDIWNWGINEQIHPWVRIASHIVIIVMTLIFIYQIYTLIMFRPWKMEMKRKLNMELCLQMHEQKL